MSDWFDRATEELEKQLDSGALSPDQFREEMSNLRADDEAAAQACDDAMGGWYMRMLDRKIEDHDCEDVPVRKEDKHIELHESIMRSREIVAALDRLVQRIEGPVPSTAENAKAEAPPTLLEVLNDDPGVINEMTEQSLNLIDRINFLLYG